MKAGLSVLVCRDCCCGSEKHADVDHDGQVATLRRALPEGGKLWKVNCLGPCEAANVVVVRTAAGRRWFGHVLAPERTDALRDWLGAGAPEPLPSALEALQIDPADIDVDLGPLETEG